MNREDMRSFAEDLKKGILFTAQSAGVKMAFAEVTHCGKIPSITPEEGKELERWWFEDTAQLLYDQGTFCEEKFGTRDHIAACRENAEAAAMKWFDNGANKPVYKVDFRVPRFEAFVEKQLSKLAQDLMGKLYTVFANSIDQGLAGENKSKQHICLDFGFELTLGTTHSLHVDIAGCKEHMISLLRTR